MSELRLCYRRPPRCSSLHDSGYRSRCRTRWSDQTRWVVPTWVLVFTGAGDFLPETGANVSVVTPQEFPAAARVCCQICVSLTGTAVGTGETELEAHERLPAPPRLSATVLLPMDRPCVYAPERWSHRPSLS